MRVVRDAKTGKGKGIAFVEFAGRGDARMALALDGRQLRGRAMRVTRVARTGAASDAQEGLGSRLRTPFSRGALLDPKCMQSALSSSPRRHMHACWQSQHTVQMTEDVPMGMCACAGVKAGQARLAEGKRGKAAPAGAAAWQGMRTKGVSKVVKGSAARQGAAAGADGAAQGPAGKRKTPGKRPAVQARKAAQLPHSKPRGRK